MSGCARGCTHYRRHVDPCPVEDHHSGAWRPLDYSDPRRTELADRPDEALPANVQRSRYGTLEEWIACRGCKPRQAAHGVLCEQCHLRLSAALAGQHRGRWFPAEGSVGWAYDWLAADREPRQANAGLDKIMAGKREPPAALALHVHDLRQDIAAALGRWLRDVCNEFDLTGPPWWSYRVENRPDVPESWRAWLPQDQTEVTSAQHYLTSWLHRVESVPELAVPMYADAVDLLVRVAGLAPWRAEPKRLRSIPCPVCERDGLAMFDGDENVTCTLCGEVITRARYDQWTALLSFEREQRAGVSVSA